MLPEGALHLDEWDWQHDLAGLLKRGARKRGSGVAGPSPVARPSSPDPIRISGAVLLKRNSAIASC
jgi:hypothetical protein